MAIQLYYLAPTVTIPQSTQIFSYINPVTNVPVSVNTAIYFTNPFVPTVSYPVITNSLSLLNANNYGYQFLQTTTNGQDSSGVFSLNNYISSTILNNILSYDPATNIFNFTVPVNFTGGGAVTSLNVVGSTGISTSGGPITGSGTITMTLGSELQGLAALGTLGMVTRTAAGTYAQRTLTGSSSISITNGNGVSGNPTLAVSNITSSQVSDLATAVKAYTLDSFAAPVNNLNMNGRRIISIADGVATADAASVGQAVRSYCYGYVTNTYSTNLNINDHIQFNSNAGFTRGSNITLDTSTTYATTTNTASKGRVTLQPGKTYKLTGCINNAYSTSWNITRWFNTDTNAAIGWPGTAPTTSSIDRASGVTLAYITPAVVTRIELRITYAAINTIYGSDDAAGPAWFLIEEV